MFLRRSSVFSVLVIFASAFSFAENKTTSLSSSYQVEVFSCHEDSPQWAEREISVYVDMNQPQVGSILIKAKKEKSLPFENLLMTNAKITLTADKLYLVDHSQLHLSVSLIENPSTKFFPATADKKNKLNCRMVTAVLPQVQVLIEENEVDK